ncbi:MAG: class I SAM-dependent methyltransferase [Deltaproteobacteria bacterium]|nr:class I SAM-dependent methyltransferase [Deltaproteobacteria bacterium]
MAKKKGKPFDKYHYYALAVQSPDADAKFMRDTYKELRGKDPFLLREDFCAAFAISCAWTKLGGKYRAVGVDFDPEPIAYGRTHYVSQLTSSQASRLEILQKNVLDQDLPAVDIVCALNFSYFGFKKRNTLRQYFQSVFTSLKKDGVLILDCFGGSQCWEPNVDETEHEDENFSYFWDQDTFNPITHHAMFYIHFKRKGERKRERVFTYDWRMWTIPELRELLEEVGFRKSTVYWEGSDDDGEGDGVFTPSEEGEDCEAWVAYIVAEK